MHKSIKTATDALDALAIAIISGGDQSRTFTDQYGWSHPAITLPEIFNKVQNLSDKIKNSKIETLEPEIEEAINSIPDRIEDFNDKTLQYLFNSNSIHAVPALLNLIEIIESKFEPLFRWEQIKDNKLLPKELIRKLSSIDADLNTLIPNKETVKQQLDLIKDAVEAAETLPIDLKSLKEAKALINTQSNEAAEYLGKIDIHLKKANDISILFEQKEKEVKKIVDQCEDAYKITTTKGLAASFDQRAESLTRSMWLWVVLLIASLIAGALIGSQRFELLNKTIRSAEEPAGYIWIQIFLSVLSLGAPVWFAWISTKQISERFKLSEDYAFKASVAKAYEGYRKEAARIDEKLEGRLFGSALSRLEEPPLRLMEKEHYGSPWHELLNSKGFLSAIETVPELKDKLLNIVGKIQKPEVKKEKASNEE